MMFGVARCGGSNFLINIFLCCALCCVVLLVGNVVGWAQCNTMFCFTEQSPVRGAFCRSSNPDYVYMRRAPVFGAFLDNSSNHSPWSVMSGMIYLQLPPQRMYCRTWVFRRIVHRAQFNRHNWARAKLEMYVDWRKFSQLKLWWWQFHVYPRTIIHAHAGAHKMCPTPPAATLCCCF